MTSLRWVGKKPDIAVARALASAGLTLDASKARMTVVCDATVRDVPLAPWLWLATKTPTARDIAHAAHNGAYDVVDVSAAHAVDVVRKLAERVRDALIEEPKPPEPPPRERAWIGQSDASQRVLAQIARAAKTSMPVLLFGETGTGKDVAAHLIHAWSARAHKSFVPIHCAAIPNELMEAELFGYAKGAFSGAVRGFDGQLTSAAGGTVFLDEIDDTPYATQVKLLRVVEDRVVTRLGESTHHHVDFRILAATNRDLRTLIEKGQFGRDLFERLAIVSIQLPPLRERLEDLPALVQHLIERFYVDDPEPHTQRTKVTHATPAALAALTRHPWTGNIRELRNVIYESLVYKRAGDALLVSDLPRRVLGGRAEDARKHANGDAALADQIARGSFNLRAAVAELERNALRIALARANGNRSEAARLLGEVGRGASSDPSGTVRAMMRRLGVQAARTRRRR